MIGRWRRGAAVGRPGGSTGCAGTVDASDGVALHVEVDDPTPGAGPRRGRGRCASPTATVVFSHGFTDDSSTWHEQRRRLAGRARVVLWDQRGHGHSGWGDPAAATVEQTGRDLAAVLDAVLDPTDPQGPVVLVGHSMGGMSILSLARQRPELFGERVQGVALLATCADGLFYGRPTHRALRLLRATRLLTAVLRVAQAVAPALDKLSRGRGARDEIVSRWVSRHVNRHYLFGDYLDSATVAAADARRRSPPLSVDAAFLDSLVNHHDLRARRVLSRVAVTVVAAGRDPMTPAASRQRIVHGRGGEQLVAVPDAAHMVHLTHPGTVTRALDALIARCTPPHA